MLADIILYMIIFIVGIVAGIFLNVCIDWILEHEDIVKTIKAKHSARYPLIAVVNGILYVMIVCVHGVNADSLFYCLLTSALLVLSVIDFRTYEIPFGINLFILALGLIRAICDHHNILSCLIGFLSVSGILAILYYATKGRAIGGGDVKLMAACGLFLGWQLIIIAFLSGCILGAIIHVIRMKVSNEGHVLAMGPYFSAGVFIAAMWGNQMLAWYLGQF